MKNISLIVFTIFFTTTIHAQSSIDGAWKMSEGDKQHHLFFQNGFFFHTVHQGNQFLMTKGGNFDIQKNKVVGRIIFNSADSSEVNTNITIPFSVSSGVLSLSYQKGVMNFDKVDDGKAPLAGVWKITGRLGSDGEVKPIHQTGTRHTYKLLTGSKFQWVAIDPAVKLFSGTGGGSYTFINGKYTEKIEFFSRDNSRVGASLTFDGKLVDGSWHHSGLSSKGDKIYEVWGKVFSISSPPPVKNN